MGRLDHALKKAVGRLNLSGVWTPKFSFGTTEPNYVYCYPDARTPKLSASVKL